jgi:hypothetical protein
MVLETLLNGGALETYRWGQTLEEVTLHVPLASGIRARHLSISIKRTVLHIALKLPAAGSVLLEGALAQPILCDESTWMVEDGHLVLTLAKDNQRNENTGPSTEWWHGVFKDEDTLDTSSVSVSDYARPDQVPAEQRAMVDTAALSKDEERRRAAETEASLTKEQRERLESLRAAFPDIPVQWGDTDGAAHG